jgi:hypothetical protein
MSIRKPLLLLISVIFVIHCAASISGNTGALLAQDDASADKKKGAIAPHSLPAPSIIYVTDFYLDPAKITKDNVVNREGILRRRVDKLQNRNDGDPIEKATKLIGILSQSIVAELRDAGLKAEHKPNTDGLRKEYIPEGVDLPKEGWMIAGWFSKVDEGNRALNATVGFGKGQDSVEIDVMVYDLSKNSREPFLHFYSGTKPKHAPGGLVTMNPYAMAVKFVLSKGATEKDVKKQGKAIARNLIECIRGIAEKTEKK